MTKRLLATLLAAALVLSLIVVPAGAVKPEENVTSVTEQCPCGCGPISQADWKPYNINSGGSAMGHYYLDGDYVQDGQKTVISGSKLVIDLRGHTLTTKGYTRLFLIEGYMAVLDTVGGGRLQAKTSGGAYGGVVMVRMNETNGSTFELYSGTVTVDADSKSSVAGGLIYVSGDKSAFRMYGGVLCGGSTAKKDSLYVYGGAIAAVTATTSVEILGGTVMDCTSVDMGGAIYSIGTTVLKNCRIINCTSAKAGGAIMQPSGTLTIKNSQILSCESTTGGGGAIYSSGATAIENSSILQCSAATNGGSICQVGGSLTTKNCEIAYGICRGDSGGGNIYTSGSFTDTGSIIRDGAALGGTGSGGNVLFGAGTHTLTGTKIYGGVTQLYGANIVNWTATTTRLIDCEIDGDVRWSGNGLSLEGKTKIGLRGNGLNLVGGSAGSVVSASKLTDGAEIYVSAHWGVFTNDSANLDYFKPALRTVLTKQTDGTLSGRIAADGEVAGYCPHCNEKVAWKGYTSSVDAVISESGHYYLSKNCTARLTVSAGKDVVIDLSGKKITSGHRCFVMEEGATLSVMDFNGAGQVVGKGGNGWAGGVIYGEKPYELNIYCGSFTYTAQTDKHVARGGIIYAPAGSNVNIYGGNFDATSYNKTGTTNIGAVVSMNDNDAAKSSVFTMTAGLMMGGTAYQGGTAHFSKVTTANVTGGMFIGGIGSNGSGNIRALGITNLSNCAVVDGTATGASGGNAQLASGQSKLENCYIANGESSTYGGSMTFSGKVQTKDTIFVGGRAPKGGNVYVAAVNAEVDMTNTTVLAGEAYIPEGSTATTDGNGGNLFFNNGKYSVNGGEFALGYAERVGGNLYNHTGCASATTYPEAADDVLVVDADAKFLNGYAKVQGGNIFTDGTAQLDSAFIDGGAAGTSGQDIYFSKYNADSLLSVGEGVTGDISLEVSASVLGTPVYGNPIAATSATALNATITLESKDLPVFAHNGTLFIGGATVADAENNETWYVDNAAAVAACGENEYVKLYTGNDLVVTKDLTVDINGQTVAVSGSGKLSAMDNSGDAYALPTGKTTGTVEVADITYAPNSNIYLAVKDGDATAYHRLGMAITDVALRTEDAGLYYKAAFSGDSVVKGLIKEYGIAASLENMPKDNFRDDPDCDSLWVGFTDAITNGAKQCGVLVKNILQQSNTAANNDENGKIPVCAAAYVTLTDGTTYVSKQNIAYSLYDFMEQLDGLIQNDPTFYRRYEKRTKEFYAAWEDKGLGDWEFDRLKAPEDPADDNEFNVIMIGSSFCYYYVEELYALLTEAGYENVNVCNVYYSGCPLSSHYSWWVGNKSNYQVYEVDHNGRKQISNAASLEFSLARRNWDVISIQESSSNIRKNGAEKHFEDTYLYHSTLLPYLKSEFPQARHLWHQTWTYQVGYDRNGYQVTSVAQQHNNLPASREFAIMMCDTYGYERVNSGEAWQVVREKYGYDNLCARIGNGSPIHTGDYYHDGDIGGAQLLNACVWFEVITGMDCTKLTYDPVYKYDGEVMENHFNTEIIKAAAHEAVQAMKAGGCAISLEPMPLPQ